MERTITIPHPFEEGVFYVVVLGPGFPTWWRVAGEGEEYEPMPRIADPY